MAYYPKFMDLELEAAYSEAAVAKEIHDEFTALVDVPVELERRDVMILISGVYYRWNGATWVIAINAGGGGIVDTVTQTGGNIVITGTADDIILNTVQDIKTTSTPTFSNVVLTNPLAVSSGGSGAASLSGVLIGNGTSAFTTKTNPSGAFVGDTDSQVLYNKNIQDATNIVYAKALHTNSGSVLVATSTQPPSAGYVLTTTSSFAATWQLPTAGTYTASNVNAAGVGVFKQLNGSDFEFRGVNAGSNKITITNDSGNNEIDVDVAEANLTLDNIGGSLSVAKGGTGNTTYTNGQLLIGNTTGNTLTKATLTQGNGMVITNSTGSIRLDSTLSLVLTGAVIVDNAGAITVNGVAQTGTPYSLSGSTLTIRADTIIDGIFTLNAGATLIIEGDFLVLGSCGIAAGASLGTRGCFHCRAKSSADYYQFTGPSSIVSFDEMSVRNYSNTTFAVVFTTGCTLSAQSIVFDSNNRILFNSGGTYTMTATDSILISNNNHTGISTQFTFLSYNLSMNAPIIRFTNNINQATYCVSVQDTSMVASNILDFTGNQISGGTTGGGVVYFGPNVVCSSDKITIKDNINLSTSSNTNSVYITTNTSLSANTIEMLNNYCTNSGAYGLRLDNTGKLKCEMLQMDLTIHAPGSSRYANVLLTTSTDLQSQFSTGRNPQFLLYNPNSATVSGFPTASYLGVVPFFQIAYEDYAVGTPITLTTALTYYNITGASSTNTNNSSVAGTIFAVGPTTWSIRYTGADTAYFRVSFNFVAAVSDSANTYKYAIAKNGSIITFGSYGVKYATNNRYVITSISQVVQLANNDEIRLFATDEDSNNRIITIYNMVMRLEKMNIM